MTSTLSVSTLGLPSAAPTVSAARTAKPSTFERSNGGASTAAITSRARTRSRASASVTVSAGSGLRSRCRSKRARASSADTTSRNCFWRAAARTRAIRSPSPLGRGFRVSLILNDSWPRSYLNRRTGRIPFAVCRHQYPAVGTRQRRQREIFACERLHLTGIAADRNEFGQSDGRSDFASKRQCLRGLTVAALRHGQPIKHSPPHPKPDRKRRVEPPGQQQHRRCADESDRRGFTRRECYTMHDEPAFAREHLHRVVVPPAAGAADCDDRICAFSRHRHAETTAAVVKPRRTAAALDIRGNQTGCGGDDAAAAQRQYTKARFSHRDAC